MKIKNIINSSNIWDLHIHSCMSPKSCGEFQKLSVKEYVDLLLKIFSDYPDLSLISITDHNSISYEVYKEFFMRDSGINIIPGIEIDVIIDGVKDSKHMLFYFNIGIDKLESFSKSINNYLKGKESVKINDILDFIISNKIQFLISPHAFKQDKRGIEFEWVDEDTTSKNAHKYMDQFFCFWEASGKSDIATAIDFLKRIDSMDKISIISFSDSNDEKKLREYLSNPTQYFISLPNYKGLQLAGTDCRRILKNQKTINENNSGNYIGSIIINGNKINLSDRLNAIVGGRGSGKSLLLDKTALSISSSIKSSVSFTSNRLSFLDQFGMTLKNFDGSVIKIDSKTIDYFNQSYVANIFNSNNISKEIAAYFSDEFNAIKGFNLDYERQQILIKYNEMLKMNPVTKPTSNISNLIGKYKLLDDRSIGFKIKKTEIKPLKRIEYDVDAAYRYAISGNKLIPAELRKNEDIEKKIYDLIEEVNNKINEYNIDMIQNNLIDLFKEKCLKLNESKNIDLKEKNQEESNFIDHMNYEYRPYIERVNIVKAIEMLQKEYVKENSNHIDKNGIDQSFFRFEKKIIFEEPTKYFKRICEKYFGSKIKKIDINDLFNTFIYDIEKNLLDSKTVEEFIDELTKLEGYNINCENNILYGKNKDNLENIVVMSPGTQTNILMEYIVSKKTNIPLLIDQPEDNIDNETIYNKLTEWFQQLKMKRQVIVVTHDANIVINADAENVIIATKNEDNTFNYFNGALEYEDILNRISIILDGGVEAVERRLKKYGR